MQTKYVTSLLDDKNIPGTLRNLLETKEPCLILFKVSGVINLSKRLWIGNDNFVVDGSSAPGPVIITGNMFYVRASNMMFRYLTIIGNRNDIDIDACWILLCHNIIFEYCTIMLGSDEVLSITKCDDIIIKNCIIANPFHDNKHAFGTILSGSDDHSTIWFINNLMANCSSRNPSFGTGNFYVANNYIYNYGHRASYTSNTRDSVCVMINNYYKSGPDTSRHNVIFNMPNESSAVTVFLHNNYIEGYPEQTEDNSLAVTKKENGQLLDIDKRGKLKIVPKKDIYLTKHERFKIYRRLDKIIRHNLIHKNTTSNEYFEGCKDYTFLSNVGNNINDVYWTKKILDDVKHNTSTKILDPIDVSIHETHTNIDPPINIYNYVDMTNCVIDIDKCISELKS